MGRLFLLLVIVGCGAPEELPPPPGDDPGTVEIEPLEDPVRIAGSGVFFAPAGAPIDHVTRLAWDVEDRWLDDFTGGFAVLDCDGDGDLDLLFTSGDGEHSLHRNAGDATFERVDDAGVAFPGDATASASVADFDNDGDSDVLLLVQFGPNRLLVNDGACRFEDQADALGLHDAHRSLHATWVDLDRDGQLDLYLTNWASAVGEDQPDVPADPHPDRLWLRSPDGGFVDATDQLLADTAEAFGMVSGFLDVPADGDFELIQTNDRGGLFVGNRLFDNLGPDADGRLQWEDVTEARGFVSDPDGMGLAFGDIDGDGHVDIFNSGNFETVFRNLGDGSFVDVGLAAGLDSPDPTSLSWGGSLLDVDADGALDLVFVRSSFWDLGPDFPPQYEDVARFFRNTNGSPELVAQTLQGTPLGGEANWRAAAVADLNGDGFEDLVISVVEEAPRIALTNPPDGGYVVQVELVGTLSNRDGRGSVVELETPSGTQLRWPGAVEAYSTGTPATVAFGVGSASSVGPLRVQWPSGQVQEVATVPAGSRVVLVEPSGAL
ncbi:MAG: CRTAC1 family protein [Proteobacteria bacterium]|nr:CRTAC1 family protein [Pseudomonadota bacterium]